MTPINHFLWFSEKESPSASFPNPWVASVKLSKGTLKMAAFRLGQNLFCKVRRVQTTSMGMRQSEATRIWTAGFRPCFYLPGRPMLGTLPPANLAFVGGHLEDHCPLLGPPVERRVAHFSRGTLRQKRGEKGHFPRRSSPPENSISQAPWQRNGGFTHTHRPRLKDTPKSAAKAPPPKIRAPCAKRAYVGLLHLV